MANDKLSTTSFVSQIVAWVKEKIGQSTAPCNIPEVNDFLVDIVLKEGVDDPQSENYIDFSSYDSMIVRCCYLGTTKYSNGIVLGRNGSYTFNLIWKNYDTLTKAL